MLQDSVCHHFVEDFCIHNCKRHRCIIFFLRCHWLVLAYMKCCLLLLAYCLLLLELLLLVCVFLGISQSYLSYLICWCTIAHNTSLYTFCFCKVGSNVFAFTANCNNWIPVTFFPGQSSRFGNFVHLFKKPDFYFSNFSLSLFYSLFHWFSLWSFLLYSICSSELCSSFSSVFALLIGY